MVKNISNTEKLAQDFLREASQLQNNIEPVKVLKARVYKIGNANVLIECQILNILYTQKKKRGVKLFQDKTEFKHNLGLDLSFREG